MALRSNKTKGRVIVVGGGFGGATCAKYLRRLAPAVRVTLVEPNLRYLTCPMSNAVLAGMRSLESLVQDYALLRQSHGVGVLPSTVISIDPVKRRVMTQAGTPLGYDRLVVAPGVDFRWGKPEGYDETQSWIMPHAWKAGEQTTLLRRQLEAMPEHGVVAISVPPAPFRCPPGPYERASLIAHYLKAHKPRAKLLILDANDQFSKQGLFLEAWKALYPGLIEWLPASAGGALQRVDGRAMTLHTELDEHRVAVANVIPSQQAGQIARDSGLADATGWCPVNPASFESTRVPGVHVIGDACIANPMPKSATSANSQAKTCALAIAAFLRGEPPPEPSLFNVCYSLAAPDYGISISGVYRVQGNAIVAVEGAGGLSPIAAAGDTRAREAEYAMGWYDSIVQDSFG
jgi:sulfide dehydrogenase [flavocytochrome c] flavoprotein subunit